jgi:hypothetical protein
VTTTVINFQDRLKTPDEVYIGNPSKWGNPFHIYRYGRNGSINQYIKMLRVRPDLVEAARSELRGKVLLCYCSPRKCHGDVLARVADGGEP